MILATIVLPIPVELGLLNPYLPAWWLLLVLAGARGVAAWLVFPFASWIGGQLDRWASRSARAAGVLRWVQERVGRHGYWALLAILSIPFMVDTAAIYTFTLLKPRQRSLPSAAASRPAAEAGAPHRLRLGRFTAVNVLAGFIRGLLVLTIPFAFGWK